MRNYTLLIVLAICINSTCLTSASLRQPAHWHPINFLAIPDGYYQASVDYYNYNTGTRATYSLKVKVSYDSVVQIEFSNGGSIHSGYNNEGYTYSGGSLDFVKDYSTGTITSATTTVTIYDSNGTRTFKIVIS